MSKHSHIFIVFLVISILSGCAVKPPTTTQWQTHQAQLKKIKHFTAKGKVALISPEQRVSAQFFWEQKGEEMSLRLTHFLGSTLFKLDIKPGVAVLTDNEGTRHVGKNAQALLLELTGVALPVNDMTQWIKGLPSENNEYSLGQGNRLASLFEKSHGAGWKVQYNAYDPNTKNLLPSKIQMIQNNQKVNLVISQWIYAP